MTNEQIWNCDKPVAEFLGIALPAWIERDITPCDIASICQGGCASGAYMPAVTYGAALRTMNNHGDDVLEYIDSQMGELPKPDQETWAGLACFYLSCAVELWAGSIMSQLEDHDMEEETEA